MIKSMTGFGRSETAWNGGTLAVEARSVNHRYCEVVVRTPKHLTTLEDRLRRLVVQHVQRGRVDVTVSMQGQKDGLKRLTLDRTLAKQYHRALRELQRELGLAGTVDLAMVAGMRDLIVVTEQPSGGDPRLERAIHRLLGRALGDLDGMRAREGKALARDLTARLRAIEARMDQIEARAPVAVAEHFSRMKGRVERLLDGREADRQRLEQELALWADRCDVTEELTRLRSHLTQLTAALKRRGSIGKTLDFLIQEVAREVNTIGSKANDAPIAALVVEIKAELEKVREQVQNVE